MLVGVHKPNAEVILLQQVQVVAQKVEQVLTLGISLQDKKWHLQSSRTGVAEPRSSGEMNQQRKEPGGETKALNLWCLSREGRSQ